MSNWKAQLDVRRYADGKETRASQDNVTKLLNSQYLLETKTQVGMLSM